MVGRGLWGVLCDVSGLGIRVLSPPWDDRTKSLIFPHKVPLVGDDHSVKISQETKNMTEAEPVGVRACVCV